MFFISPRKPGNYWTCHETNLERVVNFQWLEFWGLHQNHRGEGNYASFARINMYLNRRDRVQYVLKWNLLRKFSNSGVLWTDLPDRKTVCNSVSYGLLRLSKLNFSNESAVWRGASNLPARFEGIWPWVKERDGDDNGGYSSCCQRSSGVSRDRCHSGSGNSVPLERVV